MDPQSPERWRRIEELLDAALDDAQDTPSGSHEALCAADPEIRAEVERLLGYGARARRFLVCPAAEFAAGLLAEPDPGLDAEPSAPLERIGPYRILREAGRGGMATVYLAERDDPQLSQRVAVKVLHAGTAGRSLVRRFIRERQILASLDHPGVARLLDGGITEDGLPWFAMEYVDGVPITRYCDQRQLGLDARLRLFLGVCDAVQYAHRNLIVHRDLKPSNILVTEPTAGEELGRVKLLDFGIARLLATEGGIDGAALTRTGMIPLTPEYASPEQLRGDPVSTASDIYQLGILLYELLAGRRPHRLAGLPVHEIHRVVSETDPAQPSSVITRDDMAADHVSSEHRLSAESVSEARASNPARLRRRLRGDLDNIALMALRAEPERRYASVERLADDVRRHLERQPVSARPDTVFYRAGRFVRRHRIGVASATMTFLLLVAFAGAMAVQAGRIARERDRAEQATAFLVGLFEAFEPVEARGVSVAVPEVLQLSLERARTELADQPLLRATVIDVIGQVYDLQNMQSEAEALYEEALAIRLASLGPTHLQVAESQDRLAGLWSEAGDFHAESLYRAALATYQRKLGNDDPRAVHARMALAILLRERGSYTAADSMLSEVVASGRRREAPNLDLATSLMFLGKLRTRSGEYDEAEKLIRESMDIRQALVGGGEHPSVANSLDALGELMLARGDIDAADSLFHEALAIRRALFEEGHTDIATGLTHLSRVRVWKGDHAGADTLLGQALAIFRRSFGEDSPNVANVLEYLGANRLAEGNLESADTLLQRALAIWQKKAIEPTHDRPATLRLRIGALQMRQGELESAISLLAEGLALRQSSLPEAHWQIAEAKSLLGACLSKAGRFDEAESLLIEGYDGLRAVRGDHDAFTQQVLRLLIEHYDRSGQAERATRYLVRLQDSEAEPRTER